MPGFLVFGAGVWVFGRLDVRVTSAGVSEVGQGTAAESFPVDGQGMESVLALAFARISGGVAGLEVFRIRAFGCSAPSFVFSSSLPLRFAPLVRALTHCPVSLQNLLRVVIIIFSTLLSFLPLPASFLRSSFFVILHTPPKIPRKSQAPFSKSQSESECPSQTHHNHNHNHTDMFRPIRPT